MINARMFDPPEAFDLWSPIIGYDKSFGKANGQATQ
jgi:hypothetical protein